MWKALWLLAKARPLLAAIIVLASILALGGAVDGVSARLAATRYFDLIKRWQTAYNRDTAASKKEYEAKIQTLTADRDAYRKKWEAAKGKMSRPWTPPATSRDLEQRFQVLGYRGISR